MDIQEFLKIHPLKIDFNSFEIEIAKFISEMEAGLAGGDSSLKMIPTYVSLNDLSRQDQKVIAIDMGGTNLRIAVVVFSKKKIQIVQLNCYPMPGTKGVVTAEEFFDIIAGYIAPYMRKVSRIGVCFSFPCEIMPDLDGRIILFNKEVEVTGAQGLLIGKSLNRALQKKGITSQPRTVVINDTVATLLGGMAHSVGRKFDGYVGFILGTGTNCCYDEYNAKIIKNEKLRELPGRSLVNIESGGYSKAPRTTIDESFDLTTNAPGTQLFEKMIAGAYQGELLLQYFKAASMSKCFSASINEKIMNLHDLSAEEVSDFCYYPHGANRIASLLGDSEKDRQALFVLINDFFERAAILAAINLTAVILKTGIGQNPLMPVCISAEGSTFYKSKLFNEKINYYMKDFTQKRLHIYSEFVHAQNATILGTAMASLL